MPVDGTRTESGNYGGDEELAALLHGAGLEQGPVELRALIAGVLAAAPSVEPDDWMWLVHPDLGAQPGTDSEKALEEQLRALKAVMAARSDGPALDAAARLAALRKRLAADGLDGFVVPHGDEYQNEFLPARAERLAWLTGFNGSAGLALVLRGRAAIFVDGRYTLQVRDQVDAAFYNIRHISDEPATDWLAEAAETGMRIGFDPWLHTPGGLAGLRKAAERAGAQLVPVETNPLDAVWSDQPAPPVSPVRPHDLRYTGRDSEAKRQDIAAVLARRDARALVLTSPPSIAWLLNLRGGDVPCTPLALAYAILNAAGEVDLFMDLRKAAPDLAGHLGPAVRLRPMTKFDAALDALGGGGDGSGRVMVDPGGAPVAVFDRLERAGAETLREADPCILPKARKTEAELAGTRAAHIRDGAALVRFLAWLEAEAPSGRVTELDAARHLTALRAGLDKFRGVSFEPISGTGPNGAVVHYRVTEATNRTLAPGDLYLVDSGGQYLDGTTDVTRTVLVRGAGESELEVEARDRFTRVLKGHIGLARAVFPAGTTGAQLDVLARGALWRGGVDFDHGTGHGVGSYLGVHEGPQGISKRSHQALDPGMIVSNEPGYYKTGAYGIRIENLIVVVAEEPVAGGERPMLGFETITLAPIDRALIEPALMRGEEIAWLDAYHARVRETLAPLLDGVAADWLVEATRPLG